jgi:hypothetical protein
MTADEAIAALALPAVARVDQRIPKTLLVEHGAPTAGDKRRINEGIDQIHWVAALKPTTMGVAIYKDDAREYLEIAVLQVRLQPAAKLPRLVELLHRAVPYPVFAIIEADDAVNLSLADKRRSQGETGKTVLEGDPVTVAAPQADVPGAAGFVAALAVARQPQASLYALYQGWVDTLLALEAARVTGTFELLPTRERRRVRREALGQVTVYDADIARLRKAAAREKQMARKVQLNLELKRVEAARATALAKL